MNIKLLLSYLKEHPLLVLTLSAISCSAIGFFLEYSLLSNFGLNIGTFASVDYFLLAGITSPTVLIIFVALIVSNVLKVKILTRILPVIKSNDSIHKFWQSVIFVVICAIAVDIINNITEKKYIEIVENPTQFTSVILKTNNTPLSLIENDLTLITSTDAFMLFYQHSSSSRINKTPNLNFALFEVRG